MHITHKVLLIILDGFGIREEKNYNAIANAITPNWNNYIKKYAFGLIDASGSAVGLPNGQFGNSEVGHLNIGSGRLVQQDITRIDLAIENGDFFNNEVFLNAINTSKSGNVHIMGLLSDGGVHAHIMHIIALIKLANAQENVKNIWLHIFLDGRDTPPKSAIKYLQQLQIELTKYTKARIATLCGRYYSMDRDKRYDRIKLAYDAIVLAKSELKGNDAIEIVENSYLDGISDEFIKPYVFSNYKGFKNGDCVIFANFRADRAIQLSEAITNNNDFKAFEVAKLLKLSSFVTITCYDEKLNAKVAFLPNKINNTLGEYISHLGLKQLRISETEKYPHITYFFNGGRKEPYPNEDRILINSPRDVATYDLKPEMSLPLVTEKLVEAINQNKYDLIVTNFANADMVGHSGNFAAAVKAVNAIDIALGKCVEAMLNNGGEILIIADHGNCEDMFNYEVNQIHTQHTTNLVPCLYIGREANIKPNGTLKDVAPTILAILGLASPAEMTGNNLINFNS